MMDLLSLLLQLKINYLKKLLKFIENRTFVKKLWLSYYKIFKIKMGCEYAEKIGKPEVWSQLGHAYLNNNQID